MFDISPWKMVEMIEHQNRRFVLAFEVIVNVGIKFYINTLDMVNSLLC